MLKRWFKSTSGKNIPVPQKDSNPAFHSSSSLSDLQSAPIPITQRHSCPARTILTQSNIERSLLSMRIDKDYLEAVATLLQERRFNSFEAARKSQASGCPLPDSKKFLADFDTSLEVEELSAKLYGESFNVAAGANKISPRKRRLTEVKQLSDEELYKYAQDLAADIHSLDIEDDEAVREKVLEFNLAQQK